MAAIVVGLLLLTPGAGSLACHSGVPAEQGVSITLSTDGSAACVSNGFMCALVDARLGRITELRADFNGQGMYGSNSLSHLGVVTEVIDATGKRHRPTKSAHLRVLSNRSTVACLEIGRIKIHADAAGTVEETWILTLKADERSLILSQQGTAIAALESGSQVRHVFPCAATSLFGQFRRGALQMMNKATDNVLLTKEPLQRFYALGGNNGTRGNNSFDAVPLERQPGRFTAVASAAWDGLGEWGSALFDIVAGNFEGDKLDMWIDLNGRMHRITPSLEEAAHVNWSSTWQLTPGSHDFPYGSVSVAPNLAFEDLHTLLTAVYASPAGQLISFFPETPGMSQTSLHTPLTGYGSLVNFFDPDNFFTVTALAHSGDVYLQAEARKIVETTGSYIKLDGQVPRKIDASTQPPLPIYDPFWAGGNGQWSPIMPIEIHWILAALNVAKASHDGIAWLQGLLPKIDSAVGFLLRMLQGPPHSCYNSLADCPAPPKNCSDVEVAHGTGATGTPCSCSGGAPFHRGAGGSHLPFLLSTTGSLMNIPLRRGNFTADTNIYMVHFLRELASANIALSRPSVAAELLATADNITLAVNSHLWSDENDHYITQLNHDGTIADYVDYAANLMAIFTGVASAGRAARIVERVAKGNCTGKGKRATWVSEKPFYFEGKLQGDSTSAEGRVGLMDARARKSIGTVDALAYFNNELLGPIQQDLLEHTWLTERYDCQGKRIRAQFFFEYPCLLTMMLREVRYGINFGLTHWNLAPFGPKRFNFSIGLMTLHYDHALGAVLQAPGTGPRTIEVGGFEPRMTFIGVTTSCSRERANRRVHGTVSQEGFARFAVEDVSSCVVKVCLQCSDTIGFCESSDVEAEIVV